MEVEYIYTANLFRHLCPASLFWALCAVTVPGILKGQSSIIFLYNLVTRYKGIPTGILHMKSIEQTWK